MAIRLNKLNSKAEGNGRLVSGGYGPADLGRPSCGLDVAAPLDSPVVVANPFTGVDQIAARPTDPHELFVLGREPWQVMRPVRIRG